MRATAGKNFGPHPQGRGQWALRTPHDAVSGAERTQRDLKVDL